MKDQRRKFQTDMSAAVSDGSLEKTYHELLKLRKEVSEAEARSSGKKNKPRKLARKTAFNA